jgi:DNA-binding Lrp family transcriptional regulator
MSATIDDIDSQLLNALLSDGRASASDLADAAGVATSTATKRLARLEDDGVVEGYQPDVNYEAFGYEVTAVFRLDVEGDGLADVVDELQASGRMIGVYEVTGSDDVVAIGKFSDTSELNAQIKDLLTHEHVRSANSNIVLDTVREYDHPPIPAAE